MLAHPAKLLVALFEQLALGHFGKLNQLFDDGQPHHTRRFPEVGVGAAFRLRHRQVDDTQLQTVLDCQHQRFRCLTVQYMVGKRTAQVSVQRDGRVDGVLLHKNAVGHAQSQRPFVATLPNDHGDHRDGRLDHHGQGVGDGIADALFLRFQTWVSALGVDQRNQGELEPARQSDQPLGLA